MNYADVIGLRDNLTQQNKRLAKIHGLVANTISENNHMLGCINFALEMIEEENKRKAAAKTVADAQTITNVLDGQEPVAG